MHSLMHSGRSALHAHAIVSHAWYHNRMQTMPKQPPCGSCWTITSMQQVGNGHGMPAGHMYTAEGCWWFAAAGAGAVCIMNGFAHFCVMVHLRFSHCEATTHKSGHLVTSSPALLPCRLAAISHTWTVPGASSAGIQ